MKLSEVYCFIRGYVLAKKSASLSVSSIRKLQTRKFNAFCHSVLSSSPFYSKYVGHGLENFPIINKEIHMENFDQINTKALSREKALNIAIESERSRDFNPEYKEYSVGLSSGTSGNRGLFTLSSMERAQWSGYIIGKMLPFGLKKHKVAFFLRANNNLYETTNGLFLIFKFFDLICGIEANIQPLNEFSPSIIIAPASVLRRIAESSVEIFPNRIISVAEVLEDVDKEIIERKFNVDVEQIYQCTEGFLAATCKNGSLHLNEDINIIEKYWIDKSSGRFSPIITDLNRNTQPVVRYLLDDVLIEDPKPCSCGSSMTRIKAIEGRCDDVLSLRGVNESTVDVFPDFIRNAIISSSGEIKDYRLTQKYKDDIEVEVVPYNEEIIQVINEALNELWKKLSVVPPNCHYIELSKNDITQKQRRVLSEYHG